MCGILYIYSDEGRERMQGPEDFCSKVDLKLRGSIISTLAVLFAAACAAALLMYFLAPVDDFMVDIFRNGSVSKGSSGDFVMTMAQSDSNGAFSVTSSELSDRVFTAVICGENRSKDDIVLTPDDLVIYATDIPSGGKPRLCRINMADNVVIPSGASVEFSVSADVPEGFTYEDCRASLIVSVENNSEKYGLMLN